MKKTYRKLVRDGILQIIRSTGGRPRFRVLGRRAYLSALKRKAVEEARELAAATTPAATIEELADVLEVVRAVAEASGYAIKDVERCRRAKRAARGGFARRLFLISVDR